MTWPRDKSLHLQNVFLNKQVLRECPHLQCSFIDTFVAFSASAAREHMHDPKGNTIRVLSILLISFFILALSQHLSSRYLYKIYTFASYNIEKEVTLL